jgi:hypothetical protein
MIKKLHQSNKHKPRLNYHLKRWPKFKLRLRLRPMEHLPPQLLLQHQLNCHKLNKHKLKHRLKLKHRPRHQLLLNK